MRSEEEGLVRAPVERRVAWRKAGAAGCPRGARWDRAGTAPSVAQARERGALPGEAGPGAVTREAPGGSGRGAYLDAKGALERYARELLVVNDSPPRGSVEELDDLLTLRRPGVLTELVVALSPTSLIGSVMGGPEAKAEHVDRGGTSDGKWRWCASPSGLRSSSSDGR